MRIGELNPVTRPKHMEIEEQPGSECFRGVMGHELTRSESVTMEDAPRALTCMRRKG